MGPKCDHHTQKVCLLPSWHLCVKTQKKVWASQGPGGCEVGEVGWVGAAFVQSVFVPDSPVAVTEQLHGRSYAVRLCGTQSCGLEMECCLPERQTVSMMSGTI